MKTSLIFSAIVIAAVLGVANAGTFTTIATTGDADSGITSAKTYTHAVDIHGQSGTLNINGVNFAAGGLSESSYSLSGAPTPFIGNGNSATGQLNNLLSSFFYTGDESGNASLTLTGLTPGQNYITTFYNDAFGSPGERVVAISGSDGGAAVNIDQNSSANNLSRYSYVAPGGGSLTFTFDAVNNGASFHHYGFSNEVDVKGAFSIAGLTGDADSGISTSKTYTHAVDLGRPVIDGINTINGVSFSPDNSVGYTLSGATSVFTGDANNVTGNIGVAMTNFDYGGIDGNALLELTGLAPGTNYTLTLYGVGFGNPGNRQVSILANDGGFITNFDENQNGDNNGVRLLYTYTAISSSIRLTFDPLSNGDSFHFYAFSNEVVPEPSSFVLAAIGAIGLLKLRRRSAGRISTER